MKKIVIILAVAALALTGGACRSATERARRADSKASGRALINLQAAEPTPIFSKSQLRQNLVEIITAQAKTTQTTTFFFNQGVQDPIASCPSIGFPIPATTQLTNPLHGDGTHQVDPTGVYSGDTSGTYAICIDAKGSAYAFYWEGFVSTVTGPAAWNADSHQVELIGPSSFEFSKGKK